MLDSVTDYTQYIDRAVELGQKAIAFTEHGKISGWVKKKQYCDEKGIKYIHGVEIYLTHGLEEKVRDNYHTVLLARNYEGVKEINEVVSRSFDPDHFYYNNRITFDEFLKLSNNVITTSACLASPLNKLDVDNPVYEKLIKRYDFLEIQPHNHPEQIAFNVHLASLAKKYGKPLIVGTDTHSLDAYKAECRALLLLRKHKNYGDEDAFDLTYKTREELEEMFRVQDALPEEVYREAINNTNVMADMIEEFELDKTIKYPILYGSSENDTKRYRERVYSMLDEKLKQGIIPREQEEGFRSAVEEELEVFEKIGMSGFMLSMSELIEWCHKNDIVTGTARGSVGGSRCAYVTDIIDLNPERWKTNFARFANSDRVEVADVDTDVIETDRPRIFEYMRSRFGIKSTARVSSFGTIKDAGTIRDICGALRDKWSAKNPEASKEENPYNDERCNMIKEQFLANPDAARNNFPDIFYYFDGLNGARISQSIHPAGMIISPIDLVETYGSFYKEGDYCLFLDMDECHDVGLVKYDFLILSNIKIIKDAFEMFGGHYPKSHEIDWDDQAVWEDMLKNPTGIFQFESDFAFTLLRKLKPTSINEMALVTAAARPSGASYRNDLMSRKVHHNPSPMIDELLKDNLSYLVFQEDVIAFLQKICGLSGSTADSVRRGIAKKKMDILEKYMPQIVDGYCSKSDSPREQAEEEVKEYLKIIEDASSYMFNRSHAIAYCMIGYICAWLRYYHPYELITSYLNNAASEEDIANGTQLSQDYGIVISPPKYGVSRDEYAYDREKGVIAKGISDVKYLNSTVANELYDIAHSEDAPKTFMDLLLRMNDSSINSRQTQILINIDFFNEFGNIRELSTMYEIFQMLNNGTLSQLDPSKLPEEYLQLASDKQFISNKSKDGKKVNKRYTILDMRGLLGMIEEEIAAQSIRDLDYRSKAANQKEYLGYVDLTTGKQEDRKKLLVLEQYKLDNKFRGGVWKYKVKTKSIGSGKIASLDIAPRLYDAKPISVGDVIVDPVVAKDSKGYWQLYSYDIGN